MKFLSQVLILIILPFLSGCLMTRDDVNEENDRKVVAQQVTTLQKDHADEKMRTSELNEELRGVAGRLEALENKNSMSDKEKEKTKSANEAQFGEVNKKINALQEELQKIENQLGTLAQEIVRIDTKVPTKSSTSVAVEPTNEKKLNHFSAGEDFFHQKDYKQAIVEYQKYRDLYPKGKRFDAATYRIGMSFKNLGMNEEAKTFFEEVQSKFPDSKFAKAAKEQLKSK